MSGNCHASRQLTGGTMSGFLWPMGALTIELPFQREQIDFNLRRWAELQQDRELSRIEGRVETDRHGHIIMSPPPSANHGSYQLQIGFLLKSHMRDGRVLTECPSPPPTV